jgi:hypothetical protein
MLPVLAAYLGHVSLSSTEEYLSLVPNRFRKQLSSLSPARAIGMSKTPLPAGIEMYSKRSALLLRQKTGHCYEMFRGAST